jgi:HEAT repeat protein
MRLAAEEPRALSHLTALLAEDRVSDEGEDPVVTAVASIGEPAVEELDRLLEDASPATQARVRHALLLMGDEALPYLVRAVENTEDPARAAMALDVLAGLGARGGDAVPALIKALQDERQEVAAKAMLVLGRMGTPAYEGIPYLIAALGHPEPWGRQAAIEALAQLSVTVSGVREVLGVAAREEDEAIATGAEEALEMAETLGHETIHPDTARGGAGR